MRYSGGMSDDFCPGGVSYTTRSKGDVCVSKKEGATWQFLVRIPQCPLLYRLSGLVRKDGIKMLPLQNLACGTSSLWELVRCAWDLQALMSTAQSYSFGPTLQMCDSAMVGVALNVYREHC